MPISSIKIADFRNLAWLELKPQLSGINIITGDNGSGKTSLLEAIYFMGYGKSFRSSHYQRLIRHQQNKFSVVAQVVTETERDVIVGLERDSQGGSRLRIAEKEASSMAELASMLPIRLINTQSHQIFESGPAYRRKFIDWGLFYHSERFLITWRYFERALKQRNVLLKEQRSRPELAVWTEEVVKYGTELTNLRQEYLEALTPFVLKASSELLGLQDLVLDYLPGWDVKKLNYAEALNQHQSEDYRFGSTQYGPHRADLDIRTNAGSVKHFLSRGQQKMLICAMLVAQGMLLAERKNKDLIYLIDDLPSELDSTSKDKLISMLLKQKSQIFITAIEATMINSTLKDIASIKQVFHVEHGAIKTQANLG